MAVRCCTVVVLLSVLTAATSAFAQQSINASGTWRGTWTATGCGASGGLRATFTHAGSTLTGGLRVSDFFLQGNPEALGSLSGTLNDQGTRLTGQFRVGFGPDPTQMFADFTVNSLREEPSGSEASGVYVITGQSFCTQGTFTLRLARSLGTSACLPMLEPDGSLVRCQRMAFGGSNLVQLDRLLELPIDPELLPGSVRLQTEAVANSGHLGALTRVTWDNAAPFVEDLSSNPVISNVPGSAQARVTDTLTLHNGVGEGRFVVRVLVNATFLFDRSGPSDPFGVFVQSQTSVPSVSVNGSQRFVTFPGGPFGVPQTVSQLLTYSVPFVFGQPFVLDVRLNIPGEHAMVMDPADFPAEFQAPGYFTDLRDSISQLFDALHTAELQSATVTDANGNPLPGVTVTSESGETYGLPPEPVFEFDFTGFMDPVENPPTLNVAKAGRAIPIKFSLSGDQGLGILAAGYPKSQQIACDGSAATNDLESTSTAGESGLQYDAELDQYTYVWKTNGAWARTCRRLTVGLSDGSLHTAEFRFK